MRISLKHWPETEAAGVPQPSKTSVSIASSVDASARLDLYQDWCDALQAYRAQPASFLLFSMIGFAGASLLVIPALAKVGGDLQDAYLHASGSFSTYNALGKIEIDPANALFMLLLLQGVLGWVLSAFSCGVMAHLALYRQGAWPACLAAIRQMPALLVVSLLSSGLMGFSVVSINAGLRSAGFDLSNAGQGAITPQGMLTKAMLYASNESLPAVGSPLAEFVPYLQHTTFNDLETVMDYNAQVALTYNLPNQPAQVMSHEVANADVSRWVIAGAVAILLAQSLLCFGAPAAISTQGVFASLLRSAGWGLRYCLPVALSRSFVFGLLASMKIIFIVIPLVLVQCLIRPQQWLPNGLDVNANALSMMTICLVDAVFYGFIVIHAATLFARLTRKPA